MRIIDLLTVEDLRANAFRKTTPKSKLIEEFQERSKRLQSYYELSDELVARRPDLAKQDPMAYAQAIARTFIDLIDRTLNEKYEKIEAENPVTWGDSSGAKSTGA